MPLLTCTAKLSQQNTFDRSRVWCRLRKRRNNGTYMPNAINMLMKTQRVLAVRLWGSSCGIPIFLPRLGRGCLQKIRPRVEMLHGLDSRRFEVVRDRALAQEDEYRVNAVLVLRVFRADHDALLAKEESAAKFREAGVAHEGLAGVELDDGVRSEDVADVAHRERNRKLGFVKPRAAVRVRQVRVAALVLFVKPAGRNLEPEGAELRRIGFHAVDPLERGRKVNA